MFVYAHNVPSSPRVPRPPCLDKCGQVHCGPVRLAHHRRLPGRSHEHQRTRFADGGRQMVRNGLGLQCLLQRERVDQRVAVHSSVAPAAGAARQFRLQADLQNAETIRRQIEVRPINQCVQFGGGREEGGVAARCGRV